MAAAKATNLDVSRLQIPTGFREEKLRLGPWEFRSIQRELASTVASGILYVGEDVLGEAAMRPEQPDWLTRSLAINCCLP